MHSVHSRLLGLCMTQRKACSSVWNCGYQQTAAVSHQIHFSFKRPSFYLRLKIPAARGKVKRGHGRSQRGKPGTGCGAQGTRALVSDAAPKFALLGANSCTLGKIGSCTVTHLWIPVLGPLLRHWVNWKIWVEIPSQDALVLDFDLFDLTDVWWGMVIPAQVFKTRSEFVCGYR